MRASAAQRGHHDVSIKHYAFAKLIIILFYFFVENGVAAGAGEILLNSVDRDGLMGGMDLDLIKEASLSLSVPLIAIGGVGSMDDIKKAVTSGASAVAAGAFFVYHGPYRAVLITYPKYQDLENLLRDLT